MGVSSCSMAATLAGRSSQREVGQASEPGYGTVDRETWTQPLPPIPRTMHFSSRSSNSANALFSALMVGHWM